MSRAATLDNKWKIRFYSGSSRVSTVIVTAKDHKRAEKKAKMFRGIHGVISVSKLTRDYEHIEKSELRILTNKVMEDNKKQFSPLAMDEFLWLRRKKRIENKDKDKLDK